MYFLGVDPGKQGAASLIDEKGRIVLHSGGEINYCRFDKFTSHEIAEWFRTVAEKEVSGVLETVQPIFKAGKGSCFKLGISYGFLQGVLVGSGIQFCEVRPQKWQKEMNCLSGGDKAVTRGFAQRRWPRLSSQIINVNADSLLLADWLRRKEQGRL